MATRIRRNVKSRKRKQMEKSSDESMDSDDNHNIEPSNKKRKLDDNEKYETTFRNTLRRSSVLLQNSKHDKFIEIGINSDNKSYSIIKGALGTNGKKTIKHFRNKKIAWDTAIKVLTNKVRDGYLIVESEDEHSSSSSDDDEIEEITEGIFNGLSFSMSGALSQPQNTMEKLITNNGGKVTHDIEEHDTDFVLVKNKNAVVCSKKCVAAHKLNIPIVMEQFVHDSMDEEKMADYKEYIVDEDTHNGDNDNDNDNDNIADRKEDIVQMNIDTDVTKEEVSYNYNYISSGICLRTTDESIKAELLDIDDDTNDLETELHTMKMHQETGQILAEIKNVFTKRECQYIIQQSNRLSFCDLNKSGKYDARLRKADRLLVLDDKLSSILWHRLNQIIKEDIISTYYVSTVPLGFGVLNDVHNNEWNISSINRAMRINRYKANNDDFFTFHRDAQYAPSADQRSLFTLIIYLNDEFDGGETNFYFNNASQDRMDRAMHSDYNISEEIKYFGGINDGYECCSITPSMGDAIVFSPNIIHEGCKIAHATPNKYKYILKTDIVVKRHTHDGFAIGLQESNDYQRCLNYFMDAQAYELKGNNEKANDLYERSLFIRYLYPKKLKKLKNNNNDSAKLWMTVHTIWLTIFEYCHVREMECVSYLFPELHPLVIKWKMLFNNRHCISSDTKDTNEYIPRVLQQCGQYHCFEWNDATFYTQHEYDCCRVAAIYAFYLISHRVDSPYFVAQYNAHSQTVIAVALCQLLRDVFYHRQCHGSYFKIKKESDDIGRDFNNNVDRDYMSVVHGAECVGGVGLITDNVFKCNINESVNQENTWHEELPNNEEFLTWGKMNAITDFMSAPVAMDGCYEVDTCCGDMKYLEKWLKTKCGANKGNDDKDTYFEDLMNIKKGDNGVFGSGKTRIFTQNKKNEQYCLCPFRDNAFRFVDDLDCYNHLIFDFSKCKLDVIEDNVENANECNASCVDLKNIIQSATESNESCLKSDTLKFYKVNIASIMQESMSFNHASCQCSYPVIDTEIVNYFGYNHLKHVHIATMQTKDGKVRMWLSYNNIAAL